MIYLPNFLPLQCKTFTLTSLFLNNKINSIVLTFSSKPRSQASTAVEPIYDFGHRFQLQTHPVAAIYLITNPPTLNSFSLQNPLVSFYRSGIGFSAVVYEMSA